MSTSASTAGSAADTPVAAEDYRRAMGRWASGVTIISVQHEGQERGMTASAFISVSLSPRLILVSVLKTSHMHAYLRQAQHFGVSILSAQQREISDHFAGRPQSAQVTWQGCGGVPVVGGAVVQLACAKYSTQDGGDHTLFLGEVLECCYTDEAPLLHFRGAYHELA